MEGFRAWTKMVFNTRNQPSIKAFDIVPSIAPQINGLGTDRAQTSDFVAVAQVQGKICLDCPTK